MLTDLTFLGAAFGLALAIFKDYLKINKMWPRKHEQAVADSVSITALLIGFTNAIPYLLLVSFVYNDWLVTARTVSDLVRAFLTLLIAIGFWVHANQGKSPWKLFWEAVKVGKRDSKLFEVIAVPQNEAQIGIIQQNFPHLLLVQRRGGQVFLVDTGIKLDQYERAGDPLQEYGLYVTLIPMEQGARV